MEPELTTEQRDAIIKGLAPSAQAAQRKWNVPASVLLAQAIRQSAWGCSRVAREQNNYFNIRKHRGRGLYTELCDPAPDGNLNVFRKFRTLEACFLAHARLISTNEAYVPAMRCAGDVWNFGLVLQECGYSRDESYGQEIGKRIVNFNLTKYDVASEASAK